MASEVFVSITSDNSLVPNWHQAITLTNADWLPVKIKTKNKVFFQGNAFENVVCKVFAIF